VNEIHGGDAAAHWDAAYAKGEDRVSWFQQDAGMSLRLIADLNPPVDAAIIDVGGGASPLAASLLSLGHTDITVLDLSRAALDAARAALGEQAHRITWLHGDLLALTSPRRYAIWHDRAVLHFLTDPPDQARYAELARNTIVPGGHVVIATFAPDGPERCSGLPVQRHDSRSLTELLGGAFTEVAHLREDHRTPSGATQHFTWFVARRT